MGEGNRRDYERAIEEIRAVSAGESDAVANLANAAAILFERLPFSWVGFYRVVGEELVLGPFQGRPACVRIARGRGVCGSAWDAGEVLVVPDVHAFEGHIACDPLSRSEVVLPLRTPRGVVWGVLDIDSDRVNDFGEEDVAQLRRVAALVERIISRDSSFA